MKKVLIALLALLLVGCSNENVANITEKDNEIWTNGDKTFKSGDLYESLKGQDYTDLITSKIVKAIAIKEDIDIDACEQEVEDVYNDYLEQGYESYITYYYGSKENFIKSEVYGSIVNKLMTKVAEEKYDEYVDEYSPCKAEVAYFDSMSQAQAVIDAVESQANTFAYAASENGYTEEVTETIITDDSDLPIEVKEGIQQVNGTGLTKIIQTSITTSDADGNDVVTPRYYVVNITQKTVDKDEFLEYIVSNYLQQDTIINDYIEKHEVVIHDQGVYDLLVKKYPGVKY